VSTQSEKTATYIPLSVPHISGNEWEYIKSCLDDGWVSSVGAFVNRFEQEFAAYVGQKFGVATSSGTSALHTALMVAGIERDDEVMVSDLTFIASVNSITYVGAHPVLMDVEPNYLQMDVAKVADFLGKECEHRAGGLINKSTGRRVKAIMPVHVLGHPVDMQPLRQLADKYGLMIINDASESVGTLYHGSPVTRWAEISAYSFNGNKIMTTGSGGMVTTDDEAFAKRAKYLTTQAKDDPVEYVHEEVGYNYRLSNLQAALGVAQLEQIERFVAKKRRIAARYESGLKDMRGLCLMREAPDVFSTYWLYTVQINADEYGCDSRALMARLKAANIEARPLWRPMHLLTPYQRAQAYKIEVTDVLYQQSLSLPSSVGLTDEEQDRVIGVVRNTADAL